MGGGDALLKSAHLVGQGGLVTHSRGHPAHKGRDLAACLDIAEDIVDKEQDILLLPVSEVLGHGEPGEGHAHPGPGRLVHLAEDQSGLFNNARISHLPPEVVALAGPLSYAGENRIAAVLGGDVVYEFLDEYGLAHTGAAEQSDLASLGVGGQ